MNVVDLILVAILACVTLHFYFPEKEESIFFFFRKGEREADKGGGAQGRAGESLSGHLRGISA